MSHLKFLKRILNRTRRGVVAGVVVAMLLFLALGCGRRAPPELTKKDLTPASSQPLKVERDERSRARKRGPPSHEVTETKPWWKDEALINEELVNELSEIKSIVKPDSQSLKKSENESERDQTEQKTKTDKGNAPSPLREPIDLGRQSLKRTGTPQQLHPPSTDEEVQNEPENPLVTDALIPNAETDKAAVNETIWSVEGHWTEPSYLLRPPEYWIKESGKPSKVDEEVDEEVDSMTDPESTTKNTPESPRPEDSGSDFATNSGEEQSTLPTELTQQESESESKPSFDNVLAGSSSAAQPNVNSDDQNVSEKDQSEFEDIKWFVAPEMSESKILLKSVSTASSTPAPKPAVESSTSRPVASTEAPRSQPVATPKAAAQAKPVVVSNLGTAPATKPKAGHQAKSSAQKSQPKLASTPSPLPSQYPRTTRPLVSRKQPEPKAVTPKLVPNQDASSKSPTVEAPKVPVSPKQETDDFHPELINNPMCSVINQAVSEHENGRPIAHPTSLTSAYFKAIVPLVRKRGYKMSNVVLKQNHFICTMLPIMFRLNKQVWKQRRDLLFIKEKIEAHQSLHADEQDWLTKMKATYRLSDSADIEDLLQRVDLVPVGFLLAQAAHESGWGTSRIARNGFNFFGRTGVRSQGRCAGKSACYLHYASAEAGVSDQIAYLNSTHFAFTRSFRGERARQRQAKQTLNSAKLAAAILGYAEHKDYVRYIQNLLNGTHDLERYALREEHGDVGSI